MRVADLGLRTVRQKLRFLIIVAPCLVLVFTSIFGYAFTLREIRRDEVRKFQIEMDAKADGLDHFFDRLAVLPRCLAARQRALEPGSTPDPRTMEVLAEILDNAAPEICYGLYIAFHGINPLVKAEAIQWVDKSKSNARLDYDYNVENDRSEWYHGARRKWEARGPGKPADIKHHITEPYKDDGGSGVIIVSLTQAVEGRNGRFVGVAGVDLKCTSLDDYVGTLVEEERRGVEPGSGEVVGYLMSPKGEVVARSDRTSTLEPPSRLKMPSGGPLIRGDKSPSEGVTVDSGGTPRLLFWTTARNSGWKVVLSVPEAAIEAPARRLAKWWAIFGSGGIILLIPVYSMLAGRITGPIPRLTRAAAAVESGNYEADDLGPIADRADEFGQLARGFRRMVGEVSAREDQLREAEQDLRDRERWFRSLIENGSDLITVVEADGTIRYESPSIRRILGYEPDELVGAPRFSMVHPDDVPILTAALGRYLIDGGSGKPLEYRFRHRDGSWRTLEATSTNLLDDPAVGGIVVNSRDVTERKRDEAELAELRRRDAEELEERVRLRTAELAHKNEELQAAKEATDAAMKQQEIFLSNVAHDLRTPLTIVIGYSEDLLRRAKKKGLDAFLPDLKLIVNRGKDLLELINDLLNLSKAMSDKGVELDLKSFEVGPMIESRMEGIGAIAQKQGNAVSFRPGEGLGSMVADEAKVWRILMNLLTNACKFTKDGTIALEVAREPGDGGDRIVFRVVDTGMGMTPEQADRLFHRFAQVHATSGKMQAGVGLGLSICQLYCRSMGGTLAVDSEVGRGTTFLVSLPAEVGPAVRTPGPPAPRAPRPVPALPPSAIGGGPPDDRANLVLIIDDDASICELIRRDLGAEGFRTRAANSGEEGLRLAKQLLPSAIILDVVMPGIDGWAVLAALKTDAQMADIPIIMASMLDEKERGLRMGADEYLSKPFGRGRLAEILRKHLGNGPSARILLVEEDGEGRDLLARAIRDHGWEVAEASDPASALARLREASTDMILLDINLPGQGGPEVLQEIRSDPAGRSVPVVLLTSDDLDPEARRQIQGQVEAILADELLGRDDLLREIRDLLDRHRRGRHATPDGGPHGQDPVHRR